MKETASFTRGFESIRHNPAFGIAAKIVGCQIGYAGLLGAPLNRIPDDVGRHAIFLPLSLFRNSSEYSPFAHGRMLEPCIQKLLGP
jgi:hypothetical protein